MMAVARYFPTLLLLISGWLVEVGALDYLDASNNKGRPSDSPRFISKSRLISVERGEDVTFPCEVGQMGDNMMTFKYVPGASKGPERLYFAGDKAVLKFPRLRKQGELFMLSRVRRTDAGQYVCRVESEVPVQLRHTLDVQFPAKISRVSSESYNVVKGASVSLQCFTEGNPKPTVSWSRKGGLLPNGAMSIEGESLDFAHVDRHVEGTYICTASNGIRNHDSAELVVVVEYLPEVEVKTEIVHSDEGQLAELVCEVFGRPRPAVSWLRGDNLVDSNNHIIDDDGGHTHALTITQMTEDDFGNYTCSARNKHGRVEKSLVLTGIPTKPEINSKEFGLCQNSYKLTWRMDSYTKILQYRIRYRKTQNKDSRGAVSDSSWHDALYSPDSIGSKNYDNGNYGILDYQHITQKSGNTYMPLYKTHDSDSIQYQIPQYAYESHQVIADNNPGNGHRPLYPEYPYQDIHKDNSYQRGTYESNPYKIDSNVFSRVETPTDGFKRGIDNEIGPRLAALTQTGRDDKVLDNDHNVKEIKSKHTNAATTDESEEPMKLLPPRVLASREYYDYPLHPLKLLGSSGHEETDSSSSDVTPPKLYQQNNLLASGIIQSRTHSMRSVKVPLEMPTSGRAKRSPSRQNTGPVGARKVPVLVEKTRYMSHVLHRLETDTTYQITVAVENKYGWSEPSDIFIFYTKPEPTTTTSTTTSTEFYHPRPQVEEVGVGDLTSGSAPVVSLSQYLILLLFVASTISSQFQRQNL